MSQLVSNFLAQLSLHNTIGPFTQKLGSGDSQLSLSRSNFSGSMSPNEVRRENRIKMNIF